MKKNKSLILSVLLSLFTAYCFVAYEHYYKNIDILVYEPETKDFYTGVMSNESSESILDVLLFRKTLKHIKWLDYKGKLDNILAVLKANPGKLPMSEIILENIYCYVWFIPNIKPEHSITLFPKQYLDEIKDINKYGEYIKVGSFIIANTTENGHLSSKSFSGVIIYGQPYEILDGARLILH